MLAPLFTGSNWYFRKCASNIYGMTKPKPPELLLKRGPKPKGNLSVKYRLSVAMVARVRELAKRAGLSPSGWLERLLRSLD